MNLHLIETLSIITAIMTAVASITLIVLHVLPTGYNPIRDAVSDYGVGSYRGWFWLQVVAGGLACLFLAISLSQLRPFTPTNEVIALLVTTAARLLLPFFAMSSDFSSVCSCCQHTSGSSSSRSDSPAWCQCNS